MKRSLRRLLGHPSAPWVRGQGMVVDLYPWVADGTIDTIVPLENFFSIYFPHLDTATTAHVELFDAAGAPLATRRIDVPHLGAPVLRVSEALVAAGASEHELGTILWRLEVPSSVGRAVEAHRPFLFWDRSYVGFVGPLGQVSFVHGVDKLEVVDDRRQRRPWATETGTFTAVPEAPIDPALAEHELLLQNRATEERRLAVELTDLTGRSTRSEVHLPPRGVARHPLRAEGLDTGRPLRVRVEGLPTRYGRPILLRRFPSGAFSLMHC